MKHEELNRRLASMELPMVTAEQAQWLEETTGNRFKRDVVEFKRMALIPFDQWTPVFERHRDEMYFGLRTSLAKVFEVMCPIDEAWSLKQQHFGQAHRRAQCILGITNGTRH